MVANPIKRYSLGDRNEMDRDEEGNLTIYIQHDRPSICESDENCPNWLPAPAKRFYMILRAYLPGEDIIDRSWDPPAVIKVN